MIEPTKSIPPLNSTSWSAKTPLTSVNLPITYLQKARDEILGQPRRGIFLGPKVLHHMLKLLPEIQRFLQDRRMTGHQISTQHATTLQYGQGTSMSTSNLLLYFRESFQNQARTGQY